MQAEDLISTFESVRMNHQGITGFEIHGWRKIDPEYIDFMAPPSFTCASSLPSSLRVLHLLWP